MPTFPQEVLLSNLPKQFVERRRIVTSALGSHMQYNDTVDSFTRWLLLAFLFNYRKYTSAEVETKWLYLSQFLYELF